MDDGRLRDSRTLQGEARVGRRGDATGRSRADALSAVVCGSAVSTFLAADGLYQRGKDSLFVGGFAGVYDFFRTLDNDSEAYRGIIPGEAQRPALAGLGFKTRLEGPLA